MNPLLRSFLRRIVADDTISVIDPAGVETVIGTGSTSRDRPLRLHFLDRAAEWRVLLNPTLHFGEVYMDGRLQVENGSIGDFLALAMRNMENMRKPWWLEWIDRLRFACRRLSQYNPIPRARRNVAHHYDLDGGLFDLFLDSDRQYSCAYFEHAHASLEEAQLAKKRHLAAKLCLRDGQRVLDIGSGWGGLALTLARVAQVSVTGITLSRAQLELSRERAEREGLAASVDFRLQDYRTLKGPFDRIVSVGMFEHVGVVHYREFFKKMRSLLTEDGVMVLHSIGRFEGPGATNPWIAKYIFPGGYIPALSEVIPEIERAGLLVTDVEILRLHYAETLKAWRARFAANRDRARELYDERFCRMWEFYLAVSEHSFRHQGMMVFQIQIAKRQEALPITRDYMFESEARLRAMPLSSGRPVPESAGLRP
ncbi:MAG: cyclopropane-fatty-acyl-phospholipid synthase family protein [Rhodothalassiaceae bacterium]